MAPQAPPEVLDAADLHRTVTGVRPDDEVRIPLADPDLTQVRFRLAADEGDAGTDTVTLVVRRLDPVKLSTEGAPALPDGLLLYRAFDVSLYAGGERLGPDDVASVRLTVRVEAAYRQAHAGALGDRVPVWYHLHDDAWQRLGAVADVEAAWTYHGDAASLSPFAFGFEPPGAARAGQVTSALLAVFYLTVVSVALAVVLASRRGSGGGGRRGGRRPPGHGGAGGRDGPAGRRNAGRWSALWEDDDERW